MSTSAKVIADSVSPQGVRLSTFRVTLHRFVLAELNTHRTLSRNSASSRAIPVRKQIDQVADNLAWPVSWPAEQKGMQGGQELPEMAREDAMVDWEFASRDALHRARNQFERGLHKSVTNRLLEPFMWHTVVLTATAWENFFAQRLDADAQPEIRVAAEAMKAAMDASTPVRLDEGQWHLPYVIDDEETSKQVFARPDVQSDEAFWSLLTKISAARCARVSYLTQEGKRDIQADLDLYDRLITSRAGSGKPLHWSPLEHVATPWDWNRQEGCIHFGQDPALVGIEDTFDCVPLDHLPRTGNLLGWRSLRTEVEASMHERTYR